MCDLKERIMSIYLYFLYYINEMTIPLFNITFWSSDGLPLPFGSVKQEDDILRHQCRSVALSYGAMWVLHFYPGLAMKLSYTTISSFLPFPFYSILLVYFFVSLDVCLSYLPYLENAMKSLILPMTLRIISLKILPLPFDYERKMSRIPVITLVKVG